jgi:hypothetical protein
MEGTWSRIDDGLTPAEAAESPDVQSGHDSVRGYATALEFGFSRIRSDGLSALASDFVQQLHELVMSRDPRFQGVAGRTRR